MTLSISYKHDSYNRTYAQLFQLIRFKRMEILTIGLLQILTLLLLTPFSVYADGTPECNDGSGISSSECGTNAVATNTNATAVGRDAAASGRSATAIGAFVIANNSGSTAVGWSSAATSVATTAFGQNAHAVGGSSTALGASARASDVGSIAVGTRASAHSLGAVSVGIRAGSIVTDSPNAIAIGNRANVMPASPGAIAIGGDSSDIDFHGANAQGKQAIAIGEDAQATADGAIAIGAKVVADTAHTMQVGVPIRIEGSDGSSQLRVTEKSNGASVRTLMNLICETCTPSFRFNRKFPNNQTWFFRMLQNGDFSMDDPLTLGKEAEFRSGGDLIIGGTLFHTSSRELKTDINELQSEDVLSKLEQLPISEWSYKKDKGNVKHIGPMAEDFHALFKLGVDNKRISSIDTSGVALAAIKALKQENDITQLALARKDKEIAHLQSRNQSLLSRLEKVESQLAKLDEFKRVLSEMVVVNQLDRNIASVFERD